MFVDSEQACLSDQLNYTWLHFDLWMWLASAQPQSIWLNCVSVLVQGGISFNIYCTTKLNVAVNNITTFPLCGLDIHNYRLNNRRCSKVLLRYALGVKIGYGKIHY